ncbi:MAG TPA: glycosyltransferase [Candidatus Saccharimonadales bacterium]|nr:glycosyltransferase [Candidatus Saccharimonadales bacterium]
MLLPILFYLFIVVGTINLLHFAFYLIGANIYDLQQFRNIKQRKQRLVSKPLVSVLIPAYNEERVIERNLQSVWNNTYDSLEAIVINDGSTDNTSEAVRRFIKSRSRSYRETRARIVRSKNGLKRVWNRGNVPMQRRVKLVEQKNAGKAAALNNGIRNHAKGELIMTLDADSLIHKRAIYNAVKYFEDPSIAGVAANVRMIEEPSILGLLQRFEHLISYRSKKLFSIANCELIVGGVASTYRKSILDKVGQYDTDTTTEDIGLSMKIAAAGNKKYRLVYGADVAAMTEPVKGFRPLLRQRYRWKLGNLQNAYKYRSLIFSMDKRYTRTLTHYRMPMSFIGEILLLMEPITLAYIIYLSIHFLTIGLILGAYMTITAYILMNIWPDEHMSRRGKIKSSVYAPFLYFIFYIMNVVQLIAALRCIGNAKRIANLTAQESTWTHVERAGKAATFS